MQGKQFQVQNLCIINCNPMMYRYLFSTLEVVYVIFCSRYDVNPSNLKKCDECSKSFSTRHGLGFRHRGLVIVHHNKVHDNILYLTRTCSAIFPLSLHMQKNPHPPVPQKIREMVRQGVHGLKSQCDVVITCL